VPVAKKKNSLKNCSTKKKKEKEKKNTKKKKNSYSRQLSSTGAL
jgi:hypothetical protein